jgi:hypothetical protein
VETAAAPPIATAHLFEELDGLLLDVLRSLEGNRDVGRVVLTMVSIVG